MFADDDYTDVAGSSEPEAVDAPESAEDAAARRHLRLLAHEARATPVRVVSVRAVDAHLAPARAAALLAPCADANELGELLARADALHATLAGAGCFRRVAVDVRLAGEPAAPDAALPVEVLLRTAPRRWRANAEATVDAESAAQTSVRVELLNVTGNLDHVLLDSSFYNSASHRSLLLSYSRPSTDGSQLTAKLFRTVHNFAAVSAYNEWLYGGALRWSRGAHALQAEYVLRDTRLTTNATVAQFDDAGESIKSSLTHEYTLDRRDNPLFPSTGGALTITNEFSGGEYTGGTALFSKHEFVAQYHWPLLKELRGSPSTLSLVARGGALFAPNNDRNWLSPSDRFYVGGATSFAGFGPRGMGGGSTRRARLGGGAYWSVQALLAWPLQTFFRATRLALDVRLCLFAQLGALAQRRPGAAHALNEQLALEHSRAAVGAGLSLALAAARVSVNVAAPLRAAPLDHTQTFQLGIQLNFGQ